MTDKETNILEGSGQTEERFGRIWDNLSDKDKDFMGELAGTDFSSEKLAEKKQEKYSFLKQKKQNLLKKIKALDKNELSEEDKKHFTELIEEYIERECVEKFDIHIILHKDFQIHGTLSEITLLYRNSKFIPSAISFTCIYKNHEMLIHESPYPREVTKYSKQEAKPVVEKIKNHYKFKKSGPYVIDLEIDHKESETIRQFIYDYLGISKM